VLASLRPIAAWLVVPVVVLSIAIIVRWLIDERRAVRSGAVVNPAKWIYLASTAVLFVVILIDPIAGIMGYVGAHAIEYFVIVHQSLGRRYGSAEPADGALLGRAVRARTGRLGFLAVYVGIIVGIITVLEHAGSPLAYAIVFFTLGGMHVFYDGFIWKLRRPAVAQSLAISTS
jgi:hypothetical protein